MRKLCFTFVLSSATLLVSAQTGDATASVTLSKGLIEAKELVRPMKPEPKDTSANNSLRRTIKSGTMVTIQNVNAVNSSKDDFSPIFYENGIIFCSSAKKMSKKAEDEKVPEDLNLRYSGFDSLGKLMKPTNFARRANSKANEGPSCFSPKEDTLYLTRTASKGGIEKVNKNGEVTVKIYIKTKDTSGNFVGEMVLPFESESYSYCHPTLSADGNRLYFSSNMPGGFGGMDLWVSRRLKDGTWSQPINLGPRVNTPKNEVFPFMSEKGNLYFSSNGLPSGKGGLDLYRIEIENRTSRAFPMGEPFNTEGDDFGIMFLPKNDQKGFFSSNRKGGTGGDDIYEFEFNNK